MVATKEGEHVSAYFFIHFILLNSVLIRMSFHFGCSGGGGDSSGLTAEQDQEQQDVAEETRRRGTRKSML